MNSQITKIQETSRPLIEQIINHPLYGAIHTLQDVQIFMKYHIYAVWDFMSLLKSLQNNLTCTSVPWFPTKDANTRYLINEIVLGEESDIDLDGVRKSHFEIYVDAMKQCGANTIPIETFVKTLQETNNLQKAFEISNTPKEAQEFVNFTFQTIQTKKPCLQSAIFTFGREDLIPNMFIAIVNDIYSKIPNNLSIFKYYLERHIEVDGDHHSHLAIEMTNSLCGENQQFWDEATQYIPESLQKRITLWNGAYQEIVQSKN